MICAYRKTGDWMENTNPMLKQRSEKIARCVVPGTELVRCEHRGFSGKSLGGLRQVPVEDPEGNLLYFHHDQPIAA
jgi:hypothetical protein